MSLVSASIAGPAISVRSLALPRVAVFGKLARGAVGVFALLVASAMLFSVPASAATCSGEVLIAEAIQLPVLSETA